MNKTRFREVHGNSSFQVTIPPDFAAELKLKLGSNVKLELRDGEIIVTNADQPAVNPPKESSER